MIGPQRVKGMLGLELLGLYTCRAKQDRFFDAAFEAIRAGEFPDFQFVG